MEYEGFDRYRPGGYHPVHLGNKLNNGRYVVEHKLGYGSYATHQRRLNSYAFSIHPSHSFFPALLDEFTLEGPYGTHLCLVMEPLGLNLSTALEHARPLPLKVARRVAVQMIQAIVQLHGKGVVHGDLHGRNIVFCLPGLETWTREQVDIKLGEPMVCSVSDSDSDTENSIIWSDSGMENSIGSDNSGQSESPRDPNITIPEYFVYPPSVEDMTPLCLTDDCSIQIVDFGEAFFSHPDGVQKQLGTSTPLAVAAPEVLFKDVLTPASDIWSLGYLIFNTICGYSLWSYLTSLDDVLTDITLAYGRLPERWWTKWELRGYFFEEDGQPKEGKISPDCRDLKTMITKRLLKVRLIVAMMKLEPAERVTAKEALRLIPQAWG
ncbi:kinase-like protein [Wilcoxina mikolae CBS 423.85]|nr:kinase-like protein [Wilcoxina mikolae CBS 423.85]